MENDMAIDAASALWSVKKILSMIEKASFTVEILLLAVTALVIVLTLYFGIKVAKVLFGCLKMIYEKITDKFGTGNFSISSITSVPKKIFNFVREKISRINR